jgi:predicted dehydrogenase
MITPSQDRRAFISNFSKGVIGAGVLNQLVPTTVQAQKNSERVRQMRLAIQQGDLTPVKLSPLDAPSEKEDAPLFTPLNEKKKIGFAVVGLGHLTLEEIMPAFGACAYAKVVALVSGDPVKAKKVADQYNIPEGSIYSYATYDAIKNNPAIDAVYIVLPNSMHEEYTIRAAKAGKHVLCEKPMATSVAAAERMIAACKKANKKLMIAYRVQYEPNNRMVMDWVRNKTYGTVKLIEAFNGQNIGDPTQWRLKKELSGGGCLPDVGIYCLNTIRFLLGEEPEWVMASQFTTKGDERFKEVEETVMFQMGFPSGVQTSSITTYGTHECRKYRCLADNGGWFGMDPAFPYKGLNVEVSQAKGKVEWKQNPKAGEKNQFALEMDHMALCILQDKTPYTPGEEGLQDHRIMDAIFESAKTGKKVKLNVVTGKDPFRGASPDEFKAE